MDRIYKKMGEFVISRFPNAEAKDHLKKLLEEAKEVYDNPNDITEYADVILCTLGAAYKNGYTFTEIENACLNKLFVLENREWKLMPDGTFKHI